MNSFITLAMLIAVVGFAAGGYFHPEHDHHGKGIEVHYSVVTEHKEDGHGHGYAGHGHDNGHNAVHSWGHDGDHDHGYGGYSHDNGHGHESAHGYEHDHFGGHDGGHNHGYDHGHGGHAKYEFSYGVKDLKTGDIKNQKETRDGDKVEGSYTLKEADGTTRHVEYTADKHSGFKAVVHQLGHAHAADHSGHHEHGYAHGYGHGHGKATSYINDLKTGDIKSQKETRDGDKVEGSYTLKEADGTTRHLEYTADKHNGFKAVVHKLGHAHTAGHSGHHEHGYAYGYGHGHGKATSYINVKKHEDAKH
ncbi:hypothetical protein DOY81_005249 [Sarcophaga bullata]|nr:hypothetical protein DOY81_005249 [Sarcophaga bullata]